MIKKNLHLASFAIFGLALTIVPTQGWSQGQYEHPGQSESAGQSNLSEDQVVAIAKSQLEIIQIQQKYSAKLSEASSDKEKQDISRKANEEMVGAIQGEGLSIEFYNKVMTDVQNSPELQKRIYTAMQELQQ